MYVVQFTPVFLVIWLWIPFALSEENWRCFNDSDASLPKKYVHYMNQRTNITVQTSDRTLHRIGTEMFKIFLEETMGYAKVEIVTHDDEFQIEDVVDRLSPRKLKNNEYIPKSMVDLEVWIPLGHDLPNLENDKLVKELGDVGPPGRFGWFIPIEIDGPVQLFYNKWNTDIREVHWTFLRDTKLMAMFDVDGQNMKIIEENAKLNETHYVCNEGCSKSIYTPPHCRNSPCALLLTSSHSTMKFVVDHIKDLRLYVRVAFLGKNLKKTVEKLSEIYRTTNNNRKSLMILHYTPSDVILRERNFISVVFPECDHLNTTKSIGCKYEPNRIVKISWNKIEHLGLLQHVRDFKFSEEDYDYLLTIYERASNKSDLRQIACQYLRDRNGLWTTPLHEIYIGGIFPLHESAYNGPGIVRGAEFARNVINDDPTILKHYKLHLLVENGKCRPDSVMKIFIDYITETYYNNLVGVLGPACSETVEPLASVSKLYKTMIISYSAEGSSFSDRQQYPYFFRTIGENKDFMFVYLHLFKELGWKRMAALTEDGQKYTEYISQMQETLERHNITFVANTKFPRDRDTLQMTRYLEALKEKSARIIILDVFDGIARTVMCEAFRLKMTSSDGYVWFLPNWLNDTWFDVDFYNNFKNESTNCTTSEMLKAVNGYFSMSHSFYAPDDTVIQGNMTVKQWRQKYSMQLGNITKESNYAGYAYDAMWTYALALDKLVKNDTEAVFDLHSDNTTQKLVKLIQDTDFIGVSGHIKFRGGPSRFSHINLRQWYNNETHIVGQFFPNVSDSKPEILGGKLTLNFTKIYWFTPDRQKPDDGTPPPTKCALESLAKALNVNCEMAIVILNIILICLLFSVVFAVVFVMKRRYDKKVKYTETYMRHLGINLKMNPSQISDLDKWEIPRNSVVINRKLGEGAFGTVYGGEANFPEKGWVAVAVKTLKIGSSTEEKLDFLSEAEVMKRFEHKNVIKLLGVCTKEEPIYTIMEFMLYGDLKTFLLARRHLVNNKTTEESDDISSKRLTAMALDVARGLSYLADLKYVHRDVASRNCLINAQRVVKLGDFGMTRPMFENDYYKFTRKGMLPVRWMSPESLALGVFTPSSDVWSYGVLLYEIITFGSFPYQGMTNSEVLEYVKNGHTITIPQGVKTQLRGLLKSCWHQDPKMRTRASEIVEFLANNPRLIVPCLEVPLASIQLDDTNQFEINLPDQFRKCSTSTLKASPTIPNGIAPSHSLETKFESYRKDSIPDNGIILENCCPKEPLLGQSKSSSSLLNFGKFVSTPHHNNDSVRNDDDGDYLDHNPGPANGYVISKV